MLTMIATVLIALGILIGLALFRIGIWYAIAWLTVNLVGLVFTIPAAMIMKVILIGLTIYATGRLLIEVIVAIIAGVVAYKKKVHYGEAINILSDKEKK